MKNKWMLAFGLVLAITFTGCVADKPNPQENSRAPLETTGERINPPPGCVELRKRGGVC